MVVSTGRLAGKVALVTGCGAGIGLAVTQLFLSEGAKVFGVDFSEKNIASANSQLQSLGFKSGTYEFQLADAADEELVIAFVDNCCKAFGGLDIAILNAGIGVLTSISKLTSESWDRQMRINARGR